jgi:hypothetical protein
MVANAQSPNFRVETPASNGPEFEVASVRAIKPATGQRNPCDMTSVPVVSPRRVSGDTFTIRSTTLAGLVRDAYNVRDDQFSGLPDWASCTDLYHIGAKIPGDIRPTQDQIQLMLQGLLRARFALKVRHETKSLPVYELGISKTGLKFKLNGSDAASIRDGWSLVPLWLRFFLDDPIVDKTGLSGSLPSDFRWDDKVLAEEIKDGLPAPSVFHEVEAQLGLTLKRVTLPSEFVVIEHVERPSEN